MILLKISRTIVALDRGDLVIAIFYRHTEQLISCNLIARWMKLIGPFGRKFRGLGFSLLPNVTVD